MKSINLIIFSAIASLLAASEPQFSNFQVRPLKFPTAPHKVVTATYPKLQALVVQFEEKAGQYPTKFTSEQDRLQTYGAWSVAVFSAQALQHKEGDSDAVMAVLAHLYRQGNNMDVEGCFERARDLLATGLARYPDSIPLNREASFFYLQSGPEYVAEGEKVCLRLRKLLGTDQDIDVELGLVWAYVFQKRHEDSLRQIEHFLRIEPIGKDSNGKKSIIDEEIRNLRKSLEKGTLQIHGAG